MLEIPESTAVMPRPKAVWHHIVDSSQPFNPLHKIAFDPVAQAHTRFFVKPSEMIDAACERLENRFCRIKFHQQSLPKKSIRTCSHIYERTTILTHEQQVINIALPEEHPEILPDLPCNVLIKLVQIDIRKKLARKVPDRQTFAGGRIE